MPEENPLRFMRIGPTADRDEMAQPGEAEYADFYIAYGECFSTWSEVETRLLTLFHLVLKSPDYEAVTGAFYSTTGFRAKLELVGAALTGSKQIPAKAKESWGLIRDRASKNAKRRNELAHHVVFYGRENNGTRKIFLGDPKAPTPTLACTRMT